ncbi:hypothetical protein E1B28_011114 [Marasmius oreades]|uniref:RNB domain-containing protein n=1 Tax=Marasmius oreades TaxID=181124 RepID=A0A9P7RUS5_9AGAR|nr:uncharacterized protein E1B28_011114 [Marasmius oreades]KAG7089428.1 hypothetical protein E1B28_011114 [Marasmius oreades]
MYGRPSRARLCRPGTSVARYYADSSKKSRLRPVSKVEADQASKYMNIMVDKAAEDARTWKQTDRKRTAKLADALRRGQSSRYKGEGSTERAAFDLHVEEERTTANLGEKNEAPDRVLEPGTFIEMRKPSVTITGVVLGSQYSAKTLEYVTLTAGGTVWEHSKDSIMFDVPSIVPPDLISRCGIEPTPANDVQRNARVEVLKRLRQVEMAVHEASYGITTSPAALYDIIKSPDPTKTAIVGAAEVTRLLFRKPSMAKVFAVHKFLMSNPLYFVAAYDYPVSQTFTVRPQEKVNRIQTVTAWTKQSNSPIHPFAEKARRLRLVNQRLLADHRDAEPQRKPASHVWDENDRAIILFLLDKTRYVLGCQDDPLLLGTNFIFQRIVEDADFHDELLQTLLVELGVLAPWGDIVPLAAGLLDDRDRERRAAELVKKSFSSRRPSQIEPLGPEDFYGSDVLESVRHDFGDLPVYVIDDPEAAELDDGVSIESVSGEPGTHWVHVHIANPTAILPPTHLLADDKRALHNSLYLYHRSYPMLPRELTHHPEYGLSLSSSKTGQNVLTFSSKVNADGDITDYHVRAGIVRNKVLRSYEAVNVAMGWDCPKYTYPFGGAGPPLPDPAVLSKEDVQNFRGLAEVARNAQRRRFKDGVFNHSHSNAWLCNVQWPTDCDQYSLEPTHQFGFPKMTYRVASGKDLDVGSQSVVTECMKLACRAASLFCRDRNVPIWRRYASLPVVGSESAYQDLLNTRTPSGYIDYWRSYGALALDSIGGFSVEPKGHFGLGIPEGEGYTRVTSPLRRHSDLVAHWQIQNALLGKAPLYSAEWMQNYSMHVRAQTRMLTRMEGVHDTYYHILFLRRWIEERKRGLHKDVPDPLANLTLHTDSWPLLNMGTRIWGTEGDIQTLGLKAIVLRVDSSIPPGVEIPVTFTDLKVGIRPKLYVCPK